MGLYDELAANGRGGQLLVDTLCSVLAQVTCTSSFPPPEGFSSWDDGAVRDAAVQLLADKPAFDKLCWARAHDDHTLEGDVGCSFGFGLCYPSCCSGQTSELAGC